MLRFSIIIPAFNRVALIEKTLLSVFSQISTDYEVIVIDDGSTDGTPDEALRVGGDRISLLRQQNLGPGAARNLGAQHARGEYLVFIDSDDLWFSWTLATYDQMISRFHNPSVIGANMVYFRSELELAQITQTSASAEAFANYLEASVDGYWCGAGQMCVSRSAFLRVKGFTDLRLNMEDHDLVMKLAIEPGFVFINAPAMVAYRQHLDNVTGNSSLTYTGAAFLIEQERNGTYPGGASCQAARRKILSSHIRPASIALLERVHWHEAWSLYWKTFWWHVTEGRLRYLFGFIAMAAIHSSRKAAATGRLAPCLDRHRKLK